VPGWQRLEPSLTTLFPKTAFGAYQPKPRTKWNILVGIAAARFVTFGSAKTGIGRQHVNEPLYVDVVRSTPVAHRRTFAFSVSHDKNALLHQ
jgi:hypothetical protein